LLRIAYSVLFTLLLPLIVLRMFLRSRRAPAYRKRLAERFGVFAAPADDRPCLWVHAVSLGETLAARPLIERLLSDYPGYRVVVTTTTPTGSAQVTRLFGDRVFHVYAPWDTPGAVKRFLKQVEPRLLILIETELWPNMLHYCEHCGCQVLLANARLSARSAAGYARVAQTTRQMLCSLDWIGAQSSSDAERFVQLGMPEDRVAVTGSIKFDLQLDDAMRTAAQDLRQQWGLDQRPVIIFASTHAGEDQIALSVFSALRDQQPKALMLLAPRHPERFEEVYALCQASGLQVLRRSAGVSVESLTEILLVDSLGELLQLFALADVAVIGGSFIPRGGHNPLEAAAWALPVLCGSSMFNFADVTQRLVEVGALQLCADQAQLLEQLQLLTRDCQEADRRGAAALQVLEDNRGALSALLRGVAGLLDAHR
jgi:3-deoxy-D-manno-octulosonic-acid transferase